ncbi:MAG: outer membrane protein [Legionellaceae bacterium]
MKIAFFASILCLASPLGHAATPINGWYSSVFGGYAYIPSDLDKTRQAIRYSDIHYTSSYDAGGSLGFKSNPMRYEGELTYVNANVKHFKENGLTQNRVGDYHNGIFGLANVYYDFPGLISCLEPFLGAGLGYGWINLKLKNLDTPTTTDFRLSSSAFAYHGTAGISYNFSENYSLNVGYRYIATNSLFNYGHAFQAHLGNLGALYRFDQARYK